MTGQYSLTTKLSIIFILTTTMLVVVWYLGIHGMNDLHTISTFLGKNRVSTIDLLLQVDRDLQQSLVAERSLVFAEPNTPLYKSLLDAHSENLGQWKPSGKNSNRFWKIKTLSRWQINLTPHLTSGNHYRKV